MTTVAEAIRLIEECGEEMRKASLIQPEMFSREWLAIQEEKNKAYRKAVSERYAETQKRIREFVGPSQVFNGSLAGVQSVVTDKERYGGDF
jgi:predicted GTPase